jgi:hypothetical protein
MVEFGERDPVLHELPPGVHVHVHVHLRVPLRRLIWRRCWRISALGRRRWLLGVQRGYRKPPE